LRCYNAKRVKPRCFQDRVGQFEPRFHGEVVVPQEYFLFSTKLETFCYPTVQTAPCNNTGVWQTDGRNCRS